jgi:cytochrome b561
MQVRDTEARWGCVSQLLHWMTAALIFLQLGIAAYILSVEDLVRRFEADQLHKSWGAVIFCVAVIRAAWRLSSPVSPRMPPQMPAWQVRAARASHLALYLLLFALPISGWIYASAAPLQTLLGIENRVFDILVLPDPWSAGDEAIADLAYLVHRACALGLVLLLSVHVAAALKHHFVDRDGILSRMLP